MGDLPATFIKNPRYISEYSKAISMLESNCRLYIDKPSFVALYQHSDQTDKIIFTDDQIIVIKKDNVLSLKLNSIEKCGHWKLCVKKCKEDDYAKAPDAIYITMKSGTRHIIEVMGYTGRVRDAFSTSKLIAILKRRHVKYINMRSESFASAEK